jgi:hypothetical protein
MSVTALGIEAGVIASEMNCKNDFNVSSGYYRIYTTSVSHPSMAPNQYRFGPEHVSALVA